MAEIYDQLADAAREAARLASRVDPTQLGGPTPCPAYDVGQLTGHRLQEIVLHGWDLAVATGQTARFPDEVGPTVLRWLERDEDAKRMADWYQRPVAVGGTSALDRAVAQSGRDPAWRAP